MLVTVFCAPRGRPETTFALDVSPELELRDFVALCELESGIPAGEIQITYVEQPLKDPTRALGNYGVKDGDVVVLRQADRRPPPTQPAFPGLPHIDFRSITVPGTSSSSSPRGAVRPQAPPQQQPPPPQQQQQQQAPPPPRTAEPSTPVAFRGSSPQGLDNPALLQQMLLSNPHELSLLKERNPPLAEALLSGDLERFTKVLLEQQQDRAKREQERIRLLTADPFDLEAQAKIEEDIRQHNVEENMTIAMEEAPESFGQVVMLYINCKVNGHPVKAFVDSGAQMTIMSQACAERCNIMRLVDRRWAGIAKGVGTQKIIGRVHLAQVQIEGDFLPCSFSILEDQPMDMLLGLDMLKRHQCSIDLKKSVLLIGTTGTETRFLSEAELPECARLAYGAEGHGDARPEEMADRELAEALQRSIQESDSADGQTTSPPPPPPSSLPPTLDQMSPPTSQRPPAAPPASLEDPPSPPDLPLSPAEGASATPCRVPPSIEAPPPPGPPPACQPPVDVCEGGGSGLPPPGGSAPPAAEEQMSEDAGGDTPPHPEELPLAQPMEQEDAGADDVIEAPSPPDLVDMESSPDAAAAAAASPERDPPEGERYSSPDSIPSLAAALLELHQLLVSNNRSASCSPPSPFRQDAADAPPPDSPPRPSSAAPPTPSTATTAAAEPSDAKANHAAAAAACEGASRCPPTDLSGQDETRGGVTAETPDGSGVPGHSEAIGIPEPEAPPQPSGDLERREPPEGQQGRGVADGRASGTTTPDPLGLHAQHAFLSPLSMAAGSPEVAAPAAPPPSALAPPPSALAPPPSTPTPPPSAPHPFTEQFPAEDIQRIEAAGFSAREAAEALEAAQGVVELALLTLLARSITVPT